MKRIDKEGSIAYFDDSNRILPITDRPARVWGNGEIGWGKMIMAAENNASRNGSHILYNFFLHREDGPANLFPDGTTEIHIEGIHLRPRAIHRSRSDIPWS